VIESAHKELKQIFDGAGDAMAVIGENHRVLRTNRAFSTLFSINHDNAVGRKCFDVVVLNGVKKNLKRR